MNIEKKCKHVHTNRSMKLANISYKTIYFNDEDNDYDNGNDEDNDNNNNYNSNDNIVVIKW